MGKGNSRGGWVMAQSAAFRFPIQAQPFELRPYQTEAVADLRDSLKAGNKRVLLQAGTGCHAAGTSILLYSGRVKSVEDIVVGDRLMGPDSKPRTVSSLHRGRDEMFRVSPRSGGSQFVVNKRHLLSLKTTPGRAGIPRRIETVCLASWLTETKKFRHLRKLYRVPVEFERHGKVLPLEPYFLGLLLGDGSIIRNVSLNTPDPEIVAEVYRQGALHGLDVRVGVEPSLANSYFLSRGRNPKRRNMVIEKLAHLSIYGCSSGEKFIPHRYKTANRRDRLEILAGLLDTDGHMASAGFDYISKSQTLANDIAFVARSVGLKAHVRVCKKGIKASGFEGIYSRVSISGDCSIIPNRVERKKSPVRRQKKCPLVTGFEVESTGMGEYFGFEVDGDHLYLTADFTVHHNSGKTIVAADVIKRAVEKRSRVLFLAHRRELIDQCSDKLFRFGVHHGIIMAGRRLDLAEQVQVASIQTLWTRREVMELPEADLIVIDECFPAGTLIDGRPIESVKVGDRVWSFNHETGQPEKQEVTHKFKSRPSRFLLKVHLSTGKTLTCTPNHPIWNGHAYVPAVSLEPGDCVEELWNGHQAEEVRCLRDHLSTEELEPTNDAYVLAGVQSGPSLGQKESGGSQLQSLREGSRVQGVQTQSDITGGGERRQGSLLRRMREDHPAERQGEVGQMVGGLQPGACQPTDEGTEPDGRPACSQEDVRDATEDRAPAEGSGGQRSRAYGAAAEAGRSARMGYGGSCPDEDRKGERVPDALQDRHRQPYHENRDRGGRGESRRQGPAASGQEERAVLGAARVDRVEVFESGSNGRFGGLCPDGHVYNLEVDGNHNYFAEGILVHNCHRSLSKTYRKLIERYPAAVLLGLTATPCRTDGKGLGNMYQDMVCAPSIAELTEQGYLVPVRYFAPTAPNLEGVQVRAGDYVEKQLAERMDKATLVGDVVEHWLKFGEDRQTVVFATNVRHSQHIAEKFQEAGVKAAHLDGETEKPEREHLLADLAQGRLRVLTNCEVLCEGWDSPTVSCCVLAKPTKSLGRYLQMAGRALRPAEGKSDCLLIDHAGAVLEHGFLDDPIPWALDEKGKVQDRIEEERKKGERLPVICEDCFTIYTGRKDCPSCGKEAPRPEPVEHAAGDLGEIKPTKRGGTTSEQLDWYQRLKGIQQSRNYKPGWLAHMFKARFGIWPDRWLMMQPSKRPTKEVRAWVNDAIKRYREQKGAAA